MTSNYMTVSRYSGTYCDVCGKQVPLKHSYTLNIKLDGFDHFEICLTTNAVFEKRNVLPLICKDCMVKFALEFLEKEGYLNHEVKK